MRKQREGTAGAGYPCLVRFAVITLVIAILAVCMQGALGLHHASDISSTVSTVHPELEPPTKLNVVQGRNKKIFVTWSTPAHGAYTGFRFKVIPLTETAEGTQDYASEDGNGSHELRGLSPGASYQIHAFTLLRDVQSAAHASCNFTVRPRSPTNLVFWFRNETTLLMIWQPPFPPGFYTHYKVSIKPRDARESELYVKKEGGTPAPAQAVFLGLVPGRSYTVSVQTVSESEVSAPLIGQQRTVPARPRNLTVDSNKLQERSFQIFWLPPAEQCEFEKYQISVSLAESGNIEGNGGKRLASKLLLRDQLPTTVIDDLEPGAHYTVAIKTLSGKVSSWPSTADITLKPLAVRELQWCEAGASDAAEVRWRPAAGSTQDAYKVVYHVAGEPHDAGGSLNTTDTKVKLTGLLPVCDYTVTIIAMSRGVESEEARLLVERSRPAPALCD